MSNITDRESEQTVNSKYFSTGCVMDESLTDFQEPKKLAGPKTAPKKKSDKPKKALKRIQGQKDIRKALQSKKNELESYSKEFDNVCRQAGLDVDAEQLQLAIALSKSLQQSDTNVPETSQSLTTQERLGKIRTTLLEYGFKVPEIKINKPNKRSKRKKLYKLLLTSEEAKRQIIADRYSQVLFQNINYSNYSQIVYTDVTHIQLYNLATNASYDVLKNTDTFYVNNLLEKSTSTGNLLRDWSEIPGRPVSPKLCEPNNMNFSEIECSQDELDVVLSGTLKSCKNILKDKEASVKLCERELDKRCRINNLDNSVIVLIDDENLQPNDNEILKGKEIMMECNVDKASNIRDTEAIDLDEPTSVGNQYRSCSPDLFDDEPSNVDDDHCSNQNESPSHNISREKSCDSNDLCFKECDSSKTMKINSTLDKARSQLTQNKNVSKGCGDFMEITECVDVQCIDMECKNKKSPLISQNITKRQSNDFMEITNCVVRNLLPSAADVDLTQSPDNYINLIEPGAIETAKKDETCLNNAAAMVPTNIDVNIESTRIPKYLSMEENSKSDENNIGIIDSPKTVKNRIVENIVNKCIESLDLTQSSNTSDELPFVSLTTSTKDQSADNTIIIDPKDYEGMIESVITHDKDEILDLTQNISRHEVTNNSLISHSNDIVPNIVQNVKNLEETLDLTHELATTSRHSKTSDANVSFFDDYVHDHSDHNNSHNISCDDNFNNDPRKRENAESSKDNNDIDVDDINSSKLSPIRKSALKSDENHDIDLTQTSESSEDYSQNFHKKDHITENETVNEASIDTEIDKGSESDIDLTQNSDSELPIHDLQNNSMKDHGNDIESCDSDATIEKTIKSSQRCSSLGKIDNVSIDYDEMYDNMLRRHTQSQENRTSNSTDNNTSNVSSKSNDISNCSQNSEVFVISDNELDYSMHQSRLEKPGDNFKLGGISIMDEFSNLASFRRSTNVQNHSCIPNKDTDNVNEIEHVQTTPVKHKRVNELATPQKPGCSGINTVETPNNQYVIKTVDVTPMPMYEAMSLEELHSELDKFGVKPFKRKRAVQLLTHIYNQTHPTVEQCSDEESPCKRRRTNNYDSPRKLTPTKRTPRKILAPKKTKSSRKIPEQSPNKAAKKRKEMTKDKTEYSEEAKRLNDFEMIQTIKNYEVNEIPVLKEAECSPEDWVFQKREKAKIHSCRVPLHIAFHNYVLSRPGLREAILCYEPINIDEIHKDLVGYGHRYDPKDLLKYMDKKCITVKTTDNDARNHKR